MSKSLNNYVGLDDAPENAFGKLMSIADTLMWHYYELLLDKTASEIAQMQSNITSGSAHPMMLKKEMAQGIVARFWSSEEAAKARQHFEALFQKQDYSQATEVSIPETLPQECWIVDLLKALNAISGSSDAKRLIEAGAVLVNEASVTDFKAIITWKPGMIIKVGKKKIYKIG
jgi:tyrosyl-tRNA synthetase